MGHDRTATAIRARPRRDRRRLGQRSGRRKRGSSGSAPNTTYHYRLVGDKHFGVTAGEDASSRPPVRRGSPTNPPSAIGHETATIKAKVDPDELETKYHFEYGETTAYGSEVPTGGGKLAAGEAPVAVSAALSGLKLGVTYHYRVVASNAAGTTAGPDQTFTTVAAGADRNESRPKSAPREATLQTQINPLGHETHLLLPVRHAPAAAEARARARTSPPRPAQTSAPAKRTSPGSVKLRN